MPEGQDIGVIKYPYDEIGAYAEAVIEDEKHFQYFAGYFKFCAKPITKSFDYNLQNEKQEGAGFVRRILEDGTEIVELNCHSVRASILDASYTNKTIHGMNETFIFTEAAVLKLPEQIKFEDIEQ